MNFSMGKSKIVSNNVTTLDLSRIKELCKKNKVTLSNCGQIQFHTAYAMRGFKAVDDRNSNICFIFISILKERQYNISGYIEGSILFSSLCRDQHSITESISTSLSLSNVKDSQELNKEYEEIEKLFQALNKKSEQIIKKSNNQMMAVQQIKSSQQYMNICNSLKMLTLEIQQMCITVKARQRKTEVKSADLLQKLMEVQAAKQSLEQENLKFQQCKNELSGVNELLGTFIQKKKKEVQTKQDFYDEESFVRYLDCLVDLKKMENQKRLLAN